MSARDDVVYAALDAHTMTNGPDDGTGYRPVACKCGWVQDGNGHRAHLADVLAPLLEEAAADEQRAGLEYAADVIAASSWGGPGATAVVSNLRAKAAVYERRQR